MSNENCGKQSPMHIVQNKKNTIQRQFYVCFCAKIYSSYSALYLHAKKKHGQNISMKNLKLKRHEWGGNVKNIYHQFVQQNLDIDGCQESQEAQLAPIHGDKLRDKGKQKQNDKEKEKYKDKGRQFLQKIIQKNKIQSLQNSGYKNNNNFPKQQKQLNNQKNNKLLLQLDTLFKKYISFSKAQNGTIEILHNFKNFMKSAYENPPQHINLNININHSYNNYIHIHNNNNNKNSNINIQKDSFDFIPHCMNTFYSYNRQQNHHKNIYNHNLNYNYNYNHDDDDNEMCIKVLLKFADWLYCNAYTKYLTIEDKQYDKFIRKINEQY